MSVEINEKAYKSAVKKESVSGLKLAEEAIAFLRAYGGAALLFYGLGTIPFVFALVLFTSLMLNGLYAHLYLGPGTCLLTVLYFWMKWAQHRYMRILYATMMDPATSSVEEHFRGSFRAFAYQGITHTLALVALPFMILLLIPIPLYLAFINTVMVLDNTRFSSLRALWEESYRNTLVWVQQNLILLWFLSPLAPMLLVIPEYTFFPVLAEIDDIVVYTIFTIYMILGLLSILFIAPIASVVFINILTGLFAVITLFTSLSGIETRASFLNMAFVDTTFWLFCVAMCYLIMDPVLKCAYVLRTFHIQSLKTGDDLRSAIQRIQKNKSLHTATTALAANNDSGNVSVALQNRSSSNRVLILLTIASSIVCFSGGATHAANNVRTPIPVEVLDQSIEDTLSQIRYAWRLPRDIDASKFDNPVYDAIRGFFNKLSAAYHYVMDQLEEIINRMLNRMSFSSREDQSISPFIQTGLQIVLVAIALLLAWLLFTTIRKHLRSSQKVPLETPSRLAVIPDIHSDEVQASDLPEEDWMGMAQDLARNGDFRPAVRAVYLGMLAALAYRELIRLARYKSNAEYLQELQRRIQRDIPDTGAFREGIQTVEAVWYGGHHAGDSEFVRMVQLYKTVSAHE